MAREKQTINPQEWLLVHLTGKRESCIVSVHSSNNDKVISETYDTVFNDYEASGGGEACEDWSGQLCLFTFLKYLYALMTF